MKIMTRHLALALFVFTAAYSPTRATEAKATKPAHSTMHETIKVEGLEIFYREAGPADAQNL